MNPPTKKLSFGLNKAALPRHAVAAKAKGKARAFDAGDDSDDDDRLVAPPTAKGVSNAKLTKAQKLKQQQELELDQSAYEYDEVYDAMKQGEKLALEQVKQESSDRKASPVLLSSLGENAMPMN